MEKVKTTTPAPSVPNFYEWNLDDEEKNDNGTLSERCHNDSGTIAERSNNVDQTAIKRSMNGFRAFTLRFLQTAHATNQRIKALKLANQTPKTKTYKDVADWLMDSANIQSATNNMYKDVEDLTDNPPQKICDALMDAGLGPEDKTKWTPQNLMPVVFSVKYQKVKKIYYSPLQFWGMFSGMIVVVLFAMGILGPQKVNSNPIQTNPDEPFNIDSAIVRYERANNVIFYDWRKKQIQDTCSISSWNDIQQYLSNQYKIQSRKK